SDHPELDQETLEGAAGLLPAEQRLVVAEFDEGSGAWDAAHEGEPGLLEPADRLGDRVLRLVRMLVLVGEPRALIGAAQSLRSEGGVEPLQAIARQSEEHASSVGDEAAVAVIQADENEAPALHEPRDRAEAADGIGRVVQDAVRNDDVEALGPEHGPE